MHNRLTQFQPTPLKGTAILVTSRPYRAKTLQQATRFALQGWREAWCTQPNLRVHLCAATGAMLLGVRCRLSLTEWLWVAFAIGLVVFAELMNTAIEQTVDLVVGLRPDPLARRVKDVSAGCVLVAALIAVVVGGFTFLPHLLWR